jgi:hypothetical protein
MLRFQQIVSPEQAKAFLKKVEQLDDAYFVDRSKHLPNKSLDGSNNQYYSMSDISMPKEILDTLKEWFPSFDEEYEEILVNRYYPGMSIGPHVDHNPTPYVSVIFLEEGLQVLSCKLDEGWVPLTDTPGKMVTFRGTTVHKVDPVPRIRHSLIILQERV